MLIRERLDGAIKNSSHNNTRLRTHLLLHVAAITLRENAAARLYDARYDDLTAGTIRRGRYRQELAETLGLQRRAPLLT